MSKLRIKAGDLLEVKKDWLINPWKEDDVELYRVRIGEVMPVLSAIIPKESWMKRSWDLMVILPNGVTERIIAPRELVELHVNVVSKKET